MARTVFISYARKDSEPVEQAVEWLEVGGVEVFRDIDDIEYGYRWEDVITAKLQECERTLVFWSRNAQESEWVTKEYSIALKLGKRLVPVLLDDTPLPSILSQFHALTRFKTQRSRWPVYAGLGVAGVITSAAVGILALSVLQNQQSDILSQAPPPASMQSRPAPNAKSDTAGSDVPSIARSLGEPGNTEQVVVTNNQRSVENTDYVEGGAANLPADSSSSETVAEQNNTSWLLWLGGLLGMLLIVLGLWRKYGQSNRSQQAEQFVDMVFKGADKV